MSGQSIDIQMSSTDRQILSSLEKVNRKVDQMNTGMERVERTSAKGAQALGSMQTRALAVVSSFLSLKGALDMLNDGWERNIELGNKAASGQQQAGNAMERLLKNFSADATVKSERDIENRLLRMSDKLKIPFETVANIAAGPLSARGNLTNSKALSVIHRAAQLNPSSPDVASSIAGGAMDIMNNAGIGNVDAAIGLLLSGAGSSRVENPALYAKNAGSVLSTGRLVGDTADQSLRLQSTMSLLLSDQTGANSATAVSKIQNQLNLFQPLKEMKDERRRRLQISDDAIAAYGKARSTPERMAVLRQYPNLLEGFIGQATFEEKSSAASKALLRGEESAMATYSGVKANVLGARESAAATVAKYEGMKSTRFFKMAAAKRAQEYASGAFDIENPQARLGIASEAIESYLTKTDLVTGPDWAARKAARGQFEATVASGIDPILAASVQLGGYKPQVSTGETLAAEKGNQKRQLEVLEALLNESQKATRDRALEQSGYRSEQLPAAKLDRNRN